MIALAQTAMRDVAKNSEQGERTAQIQDIGGYIEALLGGERLMAPFSGSRGGKGDDI